MISLALGLPHTPWVPERVASFVRLRESLGVSAGPSSVPWPSADVRVFDERASNKVWPRRMWGWGLETSATHFVTLQDDTRVAPCFWPALRAMIEAKPDVPIGLSAVHPMGPEQARQGHRWYRTSSWLVGWAYVLPRAILAEFVQFVDDYPDAVAATNEDQLLNEWIHRTGRETWHPVPTIVDHDTSVASTYANDDHAHRQATVTWHGYPEAALSSADYWRAGGRLLPLAPAGLCWMCGAEPMAARAPNGTSIGKLCLMRTVGALLGVPLGGAPLTE